MAVVKALNMMVKPAISTWEVELVFPVPLPLALLLLVSAILVIVVLPLVAPMVILVHIPEAALAMVQTPLATNARLVPPKPVLI